MNIKLQMDIKISKSSLFKKIMKIVSDINTEVKFVFKNKGIYLQTIDPSHICIVELFIEDKYFSEYNISEDCVLCINLINFDKILSMCEEDINLKYFPGTSELSIKSAKSRYKLKLIDIEYDKIVIPDDCENHISIVCNTFSKCIKDFHKLGASSCKFILKENNLSVNVETDIGSGSATLVDDLIITEETIVNYDINILSIISKACVLNDIILINIKDNSPMYCEYKFGENSYINFVLAPKED
jgi:proliferating cell nuclear antigen